jgi:hypothetical protein
MWLHAPALQARPVPAGILPSGMAGARAADDKCASAMLPSATRTQVNEQAVSVRLVHQQAPKLRAAARLGQRRRAHSPHKQACVAVVGKRAAWDAHDHVAAELGGRAAVQLDHPIGNQVQPVRILPQQTRRADTGPGSECAWVCALRQQHMARHTKKRRCAPPPCVAHLELLGHHNHQQLHQPPAARAGVGGAVKLQVKVHVAGHCPDDFIVMSLLMCLAADRKASWLAAVHGAGRPAMRELQSQMRLRWPPHAPQHSSLKGLRQQQRRGVCVASCSPGCGMRSKIVWGWR